MQRIFLSILLLCCMATAHAQKPQFHFALSGGGWRPFIKTVEPYLYYYPHRNQWALGADCGVDFRGGHSVVFAPEIGYQMLRYRCISGSHHSPLASSDADLWLGSVRLGPAAKIWLGERVFLRAGVDVLLAAGAKGFYVLDWYEPNGSLVRSRYSNHLARIRSAWNIGPSVSAGYRFRLGGGNAISIGGSSFIGLLPQFAGLPREPVNPLMAKFTFEIGYAFGQKTP